MKILIVEDEKIVASLIERMLEPLGANIQKVTTKAEAMLALREEKITDVVVLDLRLPDSTAQDTLNQIHNIKTQSPASVVLVVSGLPNEEQIRAAASAANADGYLPKREAMKPGVLIELVKSIFKKRYPTAAEELDKSMAVHRAAMKTVLYEITSQPKEQTNGL